MVKNNVNDFNLQSYEKTSEEKTVVKTVVSTDPFRDYTPTGFIPLLMQYARQKGLFSCFKSLHLERKEIDYSDLDMIKTWIAAIACGCSYTKDINYVLKPYPGTARMLGLDSFPEQSSCNRFLKAFSWRSLIGLDNSFNQTAKLLYPEDVIPVLDVDCTGIIANGATYEYNEKGYFPKKRGERGYQLMYGYANDFILSLFLDPGDTSHGARFWDSYYNVCENFGPDSIMMIRGDSIHGSGLNIEELMELNQAFVLRGYDSRTARKFSQDIPRNQWLDFDDYTSFCDIGWQKISSCKYPIKIVIQRIYRPKADKELYRFICINIKDLYGDECIWLYNNRADIESLIKTEKNGLHITNLKSRKYTANLAFMYLASITHNLITAFRNKVLSKIGLENHGIKEITKRLMNIPAKIDKDSNLLFPELHPMVKQMFNN